MPRGFFLASLIAITPLLASDDCCVPLIDSCSCDPGPEEARFSLAHREPGQMGQIGYSTVSLFYTPTNAPNFHPFFDLRGHVFNNGKPAVNTGLGVRYMPTCTCLDIVWGANVFWDYTQTKRAHFEQAGFGFEALLTDFDFHINGYVPISRRKKRFHTRITPSMTDPSMMIATKRYQVMLWGGDLGIGYMIYSGCYFDLSATLDGYYFQGAYKKRVGGGFLRIASNISDYVTLEGKVSYDSHFKCTGEGMLALNFPLGQTVKRYPRRIYCCEDLIALEKRLLRKVDRFEIIVTSSHRKKQKQAATSK